MHVVLKKIPGGCVLVVQRADSTVLVQRSSAGGFFALHDLTHLVVETELGITDAFFGLLARGWDISAFENKAAPRYAEVPPAAIFVEHIVATVMRRGRDSARHDPQLLPLWAAEINEEIAVSARTSGIEARPIGATSLASIADRLERLTKEWADVPVGGQLRLTVEFQPPS